MTLVREAQARDASAVTELLGELGYPALDGDFARRNLERLRGPDDRVFVAERDRRVVGVVGIHVLPMFHAPGSLGKITALIVASGARGQGVGRALVQEAEAFALSRGAWRLEVVSGNHRPEAHEFYERLGYEPTNQTRFLRETAFIQEEKEIPL